MSTSTTHEDDESLTAPVSPKQLKTFLVHAPVMYKRQLHRGAERLILTNCYRTLWGNNKEYMQKYFFHDSTDDLSALLEKYNLFGRGDERSVVLPSNPDNVIVDPSGDEPEYWESQRGKQCGHLFKKGESVYRCRNCGLDDTCVLCSKCFHATNHDGHDVKIWISRGAGGCCDCGDPEAWKVPLECSIHSLSAASNNTDAATPEHKSEVPAELMRQMKETIEVVMDYILETFAASPEDVSPGTKEEIQRDCRDTARALGTPNHDKATTYSCVLWNDEKHSFNEVIDIVMRAAQVTATQASKIAESVDAHGRHVVDNSADLDRILRMAERIRSIKLAVTVRSTVDTVREEICGLLLDWLKELISGKYKFFNNVEGGNCILRDIICEVLCQEYSLPAGLAALSTKSRRGPMEEADVDGDIDEDILDMDDDNDDQEDVEDGEGELFETHMLVEDQDFFVELFGNTNEAWLAEETEEDEEGEEEGMEQQEEEDNDGSGGSHYEDAGSDIEMISAIEPEQNMESLPRRRIRRGSSSQPQPSSSSANSTAAKSQPSEQSQRRHSAHRIHDIADLRWDLGGWLSCTDKLELEERNFAKELGVPLLTNKMLADGNKKIRREFSRKLRCDYLLHYDLRLWKTARASIKDLLIGTLVSNFEYRPIIGTRFARNYPELVDAFFLKDREPEHSISTISVQLLTVPTVAAMLVKEYKFFAMTCSILANFFLTDKIQLLLPEEYHRMQVDCGGRAIRRHRFAYTFFDLRYVLNAEPVKVEVCQNPVYLRHFLDMLYQFQAMDPLVRSAEVHVEYESNTWVNAFNVTLQISKLCRLYADCFASLQTIMPAAEASRNLCCTICRVLKTLAEWSPHLPEQHNDRPLIKGTMDQQFKTIEMPHAGSFSVIQYHVASNPVSFHHPYHWLLSELLEHVTLLTDELLADLNITGGFKGLVQQINSQFDHDIIMSILEYPLRVRVLLAQISCGVWVRNGFGIRNQARTYRDISVRENTYDRDLYLLQTGFVIAEPNHLLTTMLDRFDIMEYFTGKPDKRHPHYDSSQLICIVEEFLDFLIICVTERAYASHMSIEDKIRRAIIQYLGLSSMAYSELIKVIPDSLSEHESFETLLGTLANYKAPGGLNDHGRYELKEEFYAEIDPYYWHFTRNQREEAFEKLQKRQSKQSSDKEFFIIPNLRKIESGPFKYLGNCLQTRVMCQIILHALWNTRIAKSVKSESILDDALYLAIVAVTDENNEVSEWRRQLSKGKFKQGTSAPVDGGFVQHAVEDKYAVMVNEFEREHVTLLTVILRFLGDREYANVHKRCTFIVDKIYELGSEEAKRIINEWRALHQEAASTEGGKGVADREAEYERRKAAAKARQAGIMAEFAKAQSQFMSQHADLYDEDEDDNLDEELEQEAVFADTGSDTDVERMFHFPSGTCIVCQEELDRSRTYGMLALIQKSKVARTTPMQDSGAMLDVLETAEHVDTWARHLEPSKDKETLLRGFPANVNPPHRHISTCGHMMHAHCFREYQTHVDNEDMRLRTPLFPGQSNSKKFLCPLCKAFGNVLLPIEWKSKKESFPGPVATHTEYDLLGEAAKEAISKLDGIEWPREAIPGSMEIESEALAGEVTDVDTLRVLYNLIKRALQNGERTRFDGANREKQCELRKAIVQLFDMYAYTISAIEIAQRGDHGVRARDVTIEHTGTFLDDISSQNQTLLKILAKTGELMPRALDSHWISDEQHLMEHICLSTLRQIFYDEAAPAPLDIVDEQIVRIPLLCDDPFQTLTRLGFAITKAETNGLEIHHLLRLLYIAQLTKTTISLLSLDTDSGALKHARIKEAMDAINSHPPLKSEQIEAARRFACNIATLAHIPASHVQDTFDRIPPAVFAALLQTFTLPYLRRSLLLMVAHHGFILQNTQDDTKPEFDRLLDILRLPEFDEAFNLLPFEQEAVRGWCRHYFDYYRLSPSLNAETSVFKQNQAITLGLPSPHYLVSLPHRMDQLFDESSRRVCRKCNTLPEYPALCLICGTFVCARRYCCTENDRGECNTHMRSCSGDIGIFLVVKESFVLLLHEDGGSIMSAPYLDTHGEADLFLRRGTPQYLNPQRYEQIRQMWLSHSIPAYVRRKMESSYSYTRWESW